MFASAVVLLLRNRAFCQPRVGSRARLNVSIVGYYLLMSTVISDTYEKHMMTSGTTKKRIEPYMTGPNDFSFCSHTLTTLIATSSVSFDCESENNKQEYAYYNIGCKYRHFCC